MAAEIQLLARGYPAQCGVRGCRARATRLARYADGQGRPLRPKRAVRPTRGLAEGTPAERPRPDRQRLRTLARCPEDDQGPAQEWLFEGRVRSWFFWQYERVRSMNWRALDRFSFGDSPALADELADLVLSGRRRATRWAVSDGPITSVGKRMVMLDGAGIPRAVLETVELVQRRFSEIDERFAFDEGEGDRTLTYWRTPPELFREAGRVLSRHAALLRAVPANRTNRILKRARALSCALMAAGGRVLPHARTFRFSGLLC